MSKLDALIAEMCPNGIEYRPLENILKIRNGSDYKGFGPGDIPVYGSGGIMTYIDHFAYDKPSVLIPRKGSVDKLYYVDTPFWNVDTVFYTEINTTIAIPRYVYHCLLKEHLEQYNTAGGVPSLTQAVLNKVRIPVPPIGVQREIVQILDNFTELTAELTARKQQYDYYRGELLSFGDQPIPVVSLEQIAEIGTGSSNTNEGLEEGAYPFFVRSQEPLRKNDYEYDETAIITAGDGVGVGKVFHYVEGKYALHQRAYRIHITSPDVLPRYYFHYMRSAFLPYIEKTMYQGSVASIRRPMLNAFPVPVPPLPVQERLISVLDNFEALCSNLNIGLPAEIEARQKQYEFYRDQLLTFAATGSTILTDRQTDRQGLIKLFWYVFGYINVRLEDVVAHKCSGATPNKAEPDYYNDGTIPWIRTQDVRFNEITEVDSYITEKAVAETAAKRIPENCVIVAISGASAGRCAINKIRATTNQHCLNLEIDASLALYRYVFHCVCRGYDDMISKKQGARGDLNSSLILSTIIPLPSLDRQREIVDLLDQFDRICNDLSDGLPAEIEARRQQYEYYRDTLLTFEAQ